MPKIAGAPVRPKKPILQGPAIANEVPDSGILPWLDPDLIEKIRFHFQRKMSREKLDSIYGRSTVLAVLGDRL